MSDIDMTIWTICGIALAIAVLGNVVSIWRAKIDANARVSAARVRRDGICGDEAPGLFVNCAETMHVICVLSFGHQSAWHEGDNGSRWRRRA